MSNAQIQSLVEKQNASAQENATYVAQGYISEIGNQQRTIRRANERIAEMRKLLTELEVPVVTIADVMGEEVTA